MIKHLLIVIVSMLMLTVSGTVVLYRLVGTFSGQDSILLSGIASGLVVGGWYGVSRGLDAVCAILASSILLSLPLVALSLFLSHAHQDYVESFAFLGIGFGLLASFIAGLGIGKHLTSGCTG